MGDGRSMWRLPVVATPGQSTASFPPHDGATRESAAVITTSEPQSTPQGDSVNNLTERVQNLRLQASHGTTSQTPTARLALPFASCADYVCLPSQHKPVYSHEVYILRMHTATMGMNVSWAPEVERLHLDEASIRAHLERLGPDYSIIDDMAKLSSEQIRFIQSGITSTLERVISVQFGMPMDFATPMGIFKSTPVIFIIRTETPQSTVQTPCRIPDRVAGEHCFFSCARVSVSPEEVRVADYAAGRKYGSCDCALAPVQDSGSNTSKGSANWLSTPNTTLNESLVRQPVIHLGSVSGPASSTSSSSVSASEFSTQT